MAGLLPPTTITYSHTHGVFAMVQRVLVDVAMGLYYLHREGCTHFDIKSPNVSHTHSSNSGWMPGAMGWWCVSAFWQEGVLQAWLLW